MLHLQWTRETKDLKLSGLGKEKGTIGDRDTTHQSRGEIWIHKKSTIFSTFTKMLSTANFPKNFRFLTVQFQGCRRVFVTGRRKSCRWLIFVVGPAWLAAANYGFVQVVDGWMLVRPPAWASGPLTTLSLSQITGVFYQILRSWW